MDLISIIVPVYNSEKYIKQCVDSILNQSYSNIEVILVDDGSLDSCPRICDDYALFDKRVKVIHKVNSGVSAARNTGIEESSGKYIMFCDSDDFVHPMWCEMLYKAVTNTNTDLGICGYSFVETDSNCYSEEKIFSTPIFQTIDKNQFFDLYMREFINMPWNKIFKKDIIVKNHLKMEANIAYNEDLLFVMKYIMHMNGDFVFINKGLIFYRKNIVGSLTNRYVENLWEIKKEVFKQMEEIFVYCGIDKTSISEMYYDKWVWAIVCCLNNNNCSKTLKKFEKYHENKKILRSNECKIAFQYGSFREYNKLFAKILKTRIYLFVFLFNKLLKFKNKFQ